MVLSLNLPTPTRIVSPEDEAFTASWMTEKSPDPSFSTFQVLASALRLVTKIVKSNNAQILILSSKKQG
jgi:hypothetical protein